MAILRFTGFKGEVPRKGKRFLNTGFAQTAQNTKLWSGELRSFRALLAVNNPNKSGTKKSIYRWAAVPGDDATGLISAIANTTPIQVTSNGHNRSNGQRIFVAGTGVANADDKTHTITVINSNTFSLGSTTAGGTSSGAGAWTRENGYWLHWLTDVDVARGPIKGDTIERIYFTGDGVPKMTYSPIAVNGGGTQYPNNDYTLGIPAPTGALTATPGAGGGCVVADQLSTAYVYTLLSALGEESAPSPPSSVISFCPGQTLDLSGMDTSLTGSYNTSGMTKNIYRVANGASLYQYVGNVALGSATFADTKTDTQLGNNITTMTPQWNPPPTDMHSIKVLPNGIGVGASKNQVYFTPPAELHAWPGDWAMPTDFPIVGLGLFDNSVVACTETVPYLITGNDPASMSMLKFANFPQSCVSKRGIVGLQGFGVVYPSPDGLVVISGAGAPSILTENYLTRDEWQAFKPSSIDGFALDGRYIGFYNTGTVSGGFIFDPKESGAGFIRLTETADGGFVDPLTDSLHIIQSGLIKKWEGGSSNLTKTYKTRQEKTPIPENFGVGRVFASSYASLTMKLYGDGTLRHTQAVPNNRPFRMPDGYLAEEWEIQIEGIDDVVEVIVCGVMDELRQV